MKFKDRFMQVLKERNAERGWQSAFAERAGIRQSSLSRIISGITKDPPLENVGAIIDAMGIEAFLDVPTIRRIGEHSPVEKNAGSGLHPIPPHGRDWSRSHRRHRAPQRALARQEMTVAKLIHEWLETRD